MQYLNSLQYTILYFKQGLGLGLLYTIGALYGFLAHVDVAP